MSKKIRYLGLLCMDCRKGSRSGGKGPYVFVRVGEKTRFRCADCADFKPVLRHSLQRR